MQMSNLLNTGLDTETLMICIKLLDEDVNPEALALLIGELKGGNATNKVRNDVDLTHHVVSLLH